MHKPKSSENVRKQTKKPPVPQFYNPATKEPTVMEGDKIPEKNYKMVIIQMISELTEDLRNK